MNFLFACGGTAGHINPALAIAEQLAKIVPKAEFLFVGAGREMENRLIPNAGYDIVNIQMSGLRRGFSFSDIKYNIKTVAYLSKAGFAAKKIISGFSPDAVIGTGGYICYPVLKNAAKMGIATVVHESNAVPGLTTKMLASTVDRVLVSFPGIENSYRKPERVLFTGTPIRGGFDANDNETDEKNGKKKPLVLSFWGSLGAERMNETIAEFIVANIQSGEFDHIHATGKSGGVEELKARLKQLGADQELPQGIELREYIDDMQNVMSAADIVLCRAGGSTVAELTAIGKPAVLVPSPYVSNNEQLMNARQLEKAGGAVILEESVCTGELLYDTVSEILGNNEKLKKMSDGQKSIGAPNAAENIARLIMGLCKGENS